MLNFHRCNPPPETVYMYVYCRRCADECEESTKQLDCDLDWYAPLRDYADMTQDEIISIEVMCHAFGVLSC